MDKNFDFIDLIFIFNAFISRRPAIANFADIIKFPPISIKKTFKDSKKLKELEIMCSNAILV